MNRVVAIVQAAAVTLERFDHAPGVAHRDPDRERAAGYAVSFVEAGAFRVRTQGAWRAIARWSRLRATMWAPCPASPASPSSSVSWRSP